MVIVVTVVLVRLPDTAVAGDIIPRGDKSGIEIDTDFDTGWIIVYIP